MRDFVVEIIRRHGPPRLIDYIERNIKESLLLRTNPIPDEQIPIGKAKVGGKPDLPTHLEWPSWKNDPLSFIAQINLADLPKHGFLNILPPEGILSFFYSATQETWGFDPKDKGSWKILHFEDQDLQRRNFPHNLPDDGIYEGCSIEYQLSVTLPEFESPFIDLDHGKSDSAEIDQFWDVKERVRELLSEGDCINRLLGHPDQIQGDMQLECQLVSHGLYCGDASGYKNPKAKELEAGALDWELLLQIDSDNSAKMMWGDVGRIYYLIPRKDLVGRNFDASWLILQCG